MTEKRLGIGGAEIVLRMDDQRAARIRASWPYRTLVKPAVDLIRNPQASGNGRSSAVPVVIPRCEELPTETPEQQAIVERVRAHGPWYHTISLGHGIRTPGHFDHDAATGPMGFPADLTGKRCLDVATLDGYWAFEMERRGADEVVALDIESFADLDLPAYQIDYFRSQDRIAETGTGFNDAKEILGSKVDRVICNIYDLSPERLGTFDFVFASDIMLHITNPVRAIQKIHSVTKGEAMLVEPFDPALDATGFPQLAQLVGFLEEVHWWRFSESYLERAIRLAGFRAIERCPTVDIRVRGHEDIPAPRAVFRACNEGASPEGA